MVRLLINELGKCHSILWKIICNDRKAIFFVIKLLIQTVSFHYGIRIKMNMDTCLIEKDIVAISVGFLSTSDFRYHAMLNSTLRAFSIIVSKTPVAITMINDWPSNANRYATYRWWYECRQRKWTAGRSSMPSQPVHFCTWKIRALNR